MINLLNFAIIKLFLLFRVVNFFFGVGEKSLLNCHSFIRIRNTQEYPEIGPGISTSSNLLSGFGLENVFKEIPLNLTISQNEKNKQTEEKDNERECLGKVFESTEVCEEDPSGKQESYISEIQDLNNNVQTSNSSSLNQESNSNSTDKILPLDELENKENLKNRLDSLLKKEKKFLKELERNEFYIKIYSNALLTDVSMNEVINRIKKYESVRKLYEENKREIEKMEELLSK
ncbi:secreted protein [Cryptosporidium felis]|nr:secreted protein [Cryptosporidium felis]